ncbi:DUF1161 domain-containing protein [Erwinia tracheiphila]|nr:DUF1161 domain-containing protein [Erwinia tracheiphila]EOS93303.1 hypothetical protein ETR_19848 [Erwinia tracheiphila PSU-1]KKF34597.1 membrane protein [Erwinia tracheiphila]UIA86270.1 DUF1161 domain-containing protein [Erwinia tracheiphila]UIA98486.1 DUF1161 domain-containing protein [Erwinia tracheiphila]
MKNIMWTLGALIIAAPLMVQASCESVKADINQKIINNGVPLGSFSLEIVPNDQADRASGQVVGHCDSDTQKIVYKRNDGESDTTSPARAGSSQDAPSS